MTDEPSVDLLVSWKGSDARRDTDRDSVSVADQQEPSGAGEVEARSSTGRDIDSDGDALAKDVVEPEDEQGDDVFEWTEEREQALLDALESTPDGAAPRVHQQLESIALALQANSLEHERAGHLIAEVEAYLASLMESEERKPPVQHEGFEKARADKLNALYAWHEAASALREFLEQGEAVQLRVALLAAEQGSAFLGAARDGLLAIDPDLDDESDESDEAESADE